MIDKTVQGMFYDLVACLLARQVIMQCSSEGVTPMQLAFVITHLESRMAVSPFVLEFKTMRDVLMAMAKGDAFDASRFDDAEDANRWVTKDLVSRLDRHLNRGEHDNEA